MNVTLNAPARPEQSGGEEGQDPHGRLVVTSAAPASAAGAVMSDAMANTCGAALESQPGASAEETEPVVSWDGRRVWRVQVTRDEMTCTGCGDVFRAGGYCVRCAGFAPGNRSLTAPQAVPTLSYLRDGEWERR